MRLDWINFFMSLLLAFITSNSIGLFAEGSPLYKNLNQVMDATRQLIDKDNNAIDESRGECTEESKFVHKILYFSGGKSRESIPHKIMKHLDYFGYVMTYGPDGTARILGTGILLEDCKTLITAGHVLSSNSSAQLRFHSFSSQKLHGEVGRSFYAGRAEAVASNSNGPVISELASDFTSDSEHGNILFGEDIGVAELMLGEAENCKMKQKFSRQAINEKYVLDEIASGKAELIGLTFDNSDRGLEPKMEKCTATRKSDAARLLSEATSAGISTNHILVVSCSTKKGHSGGPVFLSYPDSGEVRFVGVFSAGIYLPAFTKEALDGNGTYDVSKFANLVQLYTPKFDNIVIRYFSKK